MFLLTNDGGRQKSDCLVRIVAVRKERLDHIIGECQSHDSIGGWPRSLTKMYKHFCPYCQGIGQSKRSHDRGISCIDTCVFSGTTGLPNIPPPLSTYYGLFYKGDDSKRETDIWSNDGGVVRTRTRAWRPRDKGTRAAARILRTGTCSRRPTAVWTCPVLRSTGRRSWTACRTRSTWSGSDRPTRLRSSLPTAR